VKNGWKHKKRKTNSTASYISESEMVKMSSRDKENNCWNGRERRSVDV